MCLGKASLALVMVQSGLASTFLLHECCDVMLYVLSISSATSCLMGEGENMLGQGIY